MDNYQVVFYYISDSEEKEIRISSFECKNYSEMIRFLFLCKKHEIPFFVRQDDEKINKDILDKIGSFELFVDDFNVSFGSDNCIQVIEVYLK